MTISGFIQFNYLLLTVNTEIGSLPYIQDFQDCVVFYSDMCSCQGEEAINHKKMDCESKYHNILLNHIDEIKDYLLEIDDEFVFKSIGPEEQILLNLSKNNS